MPMILVCNEKTVGIVLVFTSHATVPKCPICKLYQIGVERLRKHQQMCHLNLWFYRVWAGRD